MSGLRQPQAAHRPGREPMLIHRLSLRQQVEDRWKLLFYAALLSVLVMVHALLPSSMAAHGMLIGGVFGILGHWRSTSVSSLIVPTGVMSLPDLMRWFAEIGYRNSAMGNMLAPNLSRWARFDSQNVALNAVDGGTSVVGPHYVLKRLLGYAATRRVVA